MIRRMRSFSGARFIGGAVLVIVLMASHVAAWAQLRITSIAELQEKGKTALGQAELEALIEGNTLRHARLEGTQKLDMWYSNGKRIFWSAAPGIGSRFEGPYTLSEGRRCEASTGGGEVCFTVMPTDNQQYYLCDKAGKCNWVFTVLKGNPLGIE